MLENLLTEMKMDNLKSREEMLLKLQKEKYGFLPQKPDRVVFEEDEVFADKPWTEASSLGKVELKKVYIKCFFGEKEFVFPLYFSVPLNGAKKHPVIVDFSFRRLGNNIFFPAEVAALKGFATLSLCCLDIASDDGDFKNGLSEILFENGKREKTDAGKIALWAWAAQRVLDYADSRGIFDEKCYVAVGHERLAKAALLAAATDERFFCAVANGSAVCGGELSKKKDDIKTYGLFAENYLDNENNFYFDQHYLIASVAPRLVYLSNANEDDEKCINADFLACIKATEAYKAYDKEGIVSNDCLPKAGNVFHSGNIGYHLRAGEYFFSRFDWDKALDFVRKHRGLYINKPELNPKEEIEKRNLPPLKSREEMLDILQKEEYGYLPPKPDYINFKEILNHLGSSICAGKATSKKVEVTVGLSGEEFTFPIYVTIPVRKRGPFPFIVALNFGRDSSVFERYIAVDEVIDNGFAMITLGYEDVTKDNGDFKNGLAGVIYKNKERKGSDPSKIAMWAWAAQRALDYAETQDRLDMNCAIVCGHSRLGKTALLAAATDERFKYVHSNNSGACGDAISRKKAGESLTVMTRVSRWYCHNFEKYADKEDSTEFDQHYLIASIAPRYVYVSGAYEDLWADPDSQYLACMAASSAYEKCGTKGFVAENKFPEIGDVYHDGRIGFHLREGTHYYAKEDWNKFLQFVIKHENEDEDMNI